jgi:hypothetical protein
MKSSPHRPARPIHSACCCLVPSLGPSASKRLTLLRKSRDFAHSETRPAVPPLGGGDNFLLHHSRVSFLVARFPTSSLLHRRETTVLLPSLNEPATHIPFAPQVHTALGCNSLDQLWRPCCSPSGTLSLSRPAWRLFFPAHITTDLKFIFHGPKSFLCFTISTKGCVYTTSVCSSKMVRTRRSAVAEEIIGKELLSSQSTFLLQQSSAWIANLSPKRRTMPAKAWYCSSEAKLRSSHL